MIIGVMSDTHEDRMKAIPHIIREFRERNVDFIVHCGDIETQHLSAELFGDLPVYCALTEDQVDKKEFKTTPERWIFTKPDQRIIDLEPIRIYVGHKRSFDFLTGSDAQLMATMQKLRKENDSLRWMFSGHTHHQIFSQTRLTNFVNPGAVEDSFDSFEFAVINTINNEVVFCRIMATKPIIKPFSVGVISDSANISELDPNFWQRLAKEFEKRGVEYIIHCGNMRTDDVGIKELEEFKIYYNLDPNQKRKQAPENWFPIDRENPIIEIRRYKFRIWHDLGAILLNKSELGLHKLSLKLRRKTPDLSYLLCGLTNDAFLEEGQQIRIINPGDILKDRNFAVICLPRNEITFGHVPIDPLPPL